MSVLVVMEQRAGSWNRMSFETLAAGQKIAEQLNVPVYAAVVGENAGTLAQDLAKYQLEKVHSIEHDLLRSYTPDGYTAALEQLIRAHLPKLILLPHTYQVRDFGPKLATRFGTVLVSDVIGHHVENGRVTFVRQLFQGKMNADVTLAGDGPHFASIQAGAFRADEAKAGNSTAEAFSVNFDGIEIRTKPLEPFRESQRAVDLNAADVIVAVGRGIKEKENLPLVEELAQALGAELAASRPICDNGWLPMERQVGSSGQTVSPKLYFAVGISGAIQHLVGMKGSKTIVAINRDENAPIFEVADYGVVGDLFEVIPAFVEEIKKAKA